MIKEMLLKMAKGGAVEWLGEVQKMPDDKLIGFLVEILKKVPPSSIRKAARNLSDSLQGKSKDPLEP